MLDRIGQMMVRKANQSEQRPVFDKAGEIPRHIAVIMDGNGRWAQKRNLPRIVGHRSGMQTVKEIVKAADSIGVQTLTMYAFSTENWKRPREEVDYLMKLPQEFLSTELEELIERNVRVRMLGDPQGLPPHTVEAMNIAEERTRQNTGLQLNFALNYGGRTEIVKAVQDLARKVQAGMLKPEEIDEAMLTQHLYTRDFPDPDLLIRTSGEIRLSNFMLWQLAYTELWFTDVLWPDFTKELFFEAIAEYQSRARRYGAV
ncbi:isoprenyl transferase [Brevibacillus marinus]|uniref:isoprenyl transferase n=1 Tax=Brevibacillus marinus TaxID=2496837 RepID=UPI000F84429A|nr:isoprenyl transferase [Brevibacillus marinus]